MSDSIELKIKADSKNAVQELKKVSKELGNVEEESKKADKATGGLSDQFDGITGKSGKASSSILNMGSNLKGMAGKATVALGVLTTLYGVIEKSNEKYVAYAKSVRTTDIQLKGLNVSTRNINSVHEFFNKTMEETGLQIEQVTSGYNSILSVTKDYASAQEDLERAVKLSVASNRDLVEVSRALAKARQGDLGDLKEMLLLTDDQVKSIDKLKTNTEKYTKVLNDLEPLLSQDLNPALDNTDKLINKINSKFDRGAESAGNFFREVSNALAAGVVGNDERNAKVRELLKQENDALLQGGFKGPQQLPDVPVGEVEQPVKTKQVLTDEEKKANQEKARAIALQRALNEVEMDRISTLEKYATNRKNLFEEANSMSEDELKIELKKLETIKSQEEIDLEYRTNVLRGMSEEMAIRIANVASINLEADAKQELHDQEMKNAEEKAKKAKEAKEAQEDLEDAIKQLKISNAGEEKKIEDDKNKELEKAEEDRVAALRAGAEAAVVLAGVAGAGEKELALLKGGIETAESIAAFANGNIAGGIGHAAAATQFFAVAGGAGGASGGGGAGGGASKADLAALQSQRLEAQKQNTMALKEAFSEALKEANAEGRNITYVINQNGTYLGNDNTSLVRIKETLDQTQRLQFR